MKEKPELKSRFVNYLIAGGILTGAIGLIIKLSSLGSDAIAAPSPVEPAPSGPPPLCKTLYRYLDGSVGPESKLGATYVGLDCGNWVPEEWKAPKKLPGEIPQIPIPTPDKPTEPVKPQPIRPIGPFPPEGDQYLA